MSIAGAEAVGAVIPLAVTVGVAGKVMEGVGEKGKVPAKSKAKRRKAKGKPRSRRPKFSMGKGR